MAILVAVIAGCDLADPYRADGWGSSGLEVPGPVGPTIRPDWEQVTARAAAIIEQALLTAMDQGPVDTVELNETLPFGTESFQWIPAASRDTQLPPGGHGRRIYQVEVFTTPAAGKAVTVVTFDDQFGATFRFDLSTEASDRLFDMLMPEN